MSFVSRERPIPPPTFPVFLISLCPLLSTLLFDIVQIKHPVNYLDFPHRIVTPEKVARSSDFVLSYLPLSSTRLNSDPRRRSSGFNEGEGPRSLQSTTPHTISQRQANHSGRRIAHPSSALPSVQPFAIQPLSNRAASFLSGRKQRPPLDIAC